MIRQLTLATIFALITSAIIGCSQGSPVDVSPQAGEAISNAAEGHILWGYYQFAIDPVMGTVEVLPLRLAGVHMNVKQYVLPPNCSDCLIIQPTGPYKDNILPVDVSLKNPTALTGHDVRGILISNDAGLYLANPDNYTDLYDDGGAVTINPFKAYATGIPDRSFAPQALFPASYQIFLSSMGKVSLINYAIDASWPGRAKEPYRVEDPVLDGILDTNGTNDVTLSVDVLAAGNDVDEVLFDATNLGFTSPITMTNTGGNTWEVVFKNTELKPAGQYTCMIKASTASSPKYLYTYFNVTVVVPPTSLQNDVQPIFDNYCIDCHQSVSPPLGLDLSVGNAYSHTVNVASTEAPTFKRINPNNAQLSYLLAKIRGVHMNPPFNGSGGRMPLNGPPYLTMDEINTITMWVMQGANDN